MELKEMTIDELNAVRDLRAELALERRRLEDLRACADSMTRELDGLPKAKATTSAVEKIAVAILESEARITELTRAIVDVSAELVEAISTTIRKPLMMSAMIRRYVACETLSTISAKLFVCKAYVGRLCERGVKMMTGSTT